MSEAEATSGSAENAAAADESSLPAADADSQRRLGAFLTGLPSFKRDNFARYSSSDGAGASPVTTAGNSSRRGRPSVYICTKDYPAEQVITTEKTNILLRYLHQQWDRKNLHAKRAGSRPDAEDGGGGGGGSSPGPPANKISKVDLRIQ